MKKFRFDVSKADYDLCWKQCLRNIVVNWYFGFRLASNEAPQNPSMGQRESSRILGAGWRLRGEEGCENTEKKQIVERIIEDGPE